MTKEFINFPSINQLYDAILNVKDRAGYQGKDEAGNAVYSSVSEKPTLRYIGYPKLHGTCSAIVFQGEDPNTLAFHFQSRDRILTVEKDNYHFAATMLKHIHCFKDLLRAVTVGHPNRPKSVAIFGEWVGDRVSGSVCAIDLVSRRFVVFAVRIDEEWQDIRGFNFSELKAPIYNVSDYGYYEVDIDFNNPEASRELLEAKTLEVEKLCPVAQAMGVEGPGEGVVWHCKNYGWDESRFWFKVKGAKHKETSTKQLTEVELETMKSADEFIAATLTNERLEHALQWLRNEAKLPMQQTSLGPFVQRAIGDMLKEEGARLEASGLTKRDVSKPAGKVASAWFVDKLRSEAFA